MNNVEKLRIARKLMSEVQRTLDNNTVKCDHCGHVRSSNQEDRTMWEMLNAAIERADKVANWMERRQDEISQSEG